MLCCGDPSARDPFIYATATPHPDAGGDAGRPSDEGLIDDSTGPSQEIDPTLGGPCLDDAQCDDGVECTFDACDPELERCRFTPDDASCQDGVYCNGVEVCSSTRGCRPGEVVDCDDQTACTIDRCLEQEQSCAHEPRDADGDGDPDGRCPGGTDCNDEDANVSGARPEVCGNGLDDDCDLDVDEIDCVAAQYDECEGALEVVASGTYLLPGQAAKNDGASECALGGSVDLFVEVVVADEAKDVVLTLRGEAAHVALSALGQCDDPSTETQCNGSEPSEADTQVARLLLRGLTAGRYYFAAFSAVATELELAVAFEPPTTTSDDETCAGTTFLTEGESTLVDLLDSEPDLASRCQEGQGDRVLKFLVDEPSDIRVLAASADGFGEPSLSLRGAACVEDEVTCVSGSDAELFARGVPPGEYALGVSSSVPSRVQVLLDIVPETAAPAGDDCDSPPALPRNETIDLSLADFDDSLSLGCLEGARDAVWRLGIDEPSDVLLVLRVSEMDTAAVGLGPAGSCTELESLGCAAGDRSPVRLLRHRLLPGEYDVVVESRLGSDAQLLALVRPATPPTLATGAEDCASFLDMSAEGGSFQGNTAGAIADFSASCDVGGISEHGAGDHLLRLVLESRKRVFLDLDGSAFGTVLSVRQGPECPGKEVACVATLEAPRSYFDRVLEPGEYYVQVDGFAGLEGQWFLESFAIDP